MKEESINKKIEEANKKIVIKIIYVIMMIVLCFLFLFPIYWMIVNSLKSQDQIFAQMSSVKTFLPVGLNGKVIDSYITLFTTFDNFTRAVLNSIIYSSITILGVLLINSFAGYALARIIFPGSKTIVTIILLLIIIPVETSIVPLYVILFRLGLLTGNMRIIGYLIPSFVSPFYIFMFRQFFLGMPRELEEAATIDGCNRFKTYFFIIMPLSKAIFATVAIFTFMGAWNDYVFAQLMFSKPEMQPLQVFLQLVNTFNPKDISVVLASLTISTIPIAIVYIFCQKYIVEGVSFSGLK
jgi:fructooligosaccharide transport system permease protein